MHKQQRQNKVPDTPEYIDTTTKISLSYHGAQMYLNDQT